MDGATLQRRLDGSGQEAIGVVGVRTWTLVNGSVISSFSLETRGYCARSNLTLTRPETCPNSFSLIIECVSISLSPESRSSLVGLVRIRNYIV